MVYSQLTNYGNEIVQSLSRDRSAVFIPYGSGKTRIVAHYASLWDFDQVIVFCSKLNIPNWEQEFKTLGYLTYGLDDLSFFMSTSLPNQDGPRGKHLPLKRALVVHHQVISREEILHQLRSYDCLSHRSLVVMDESTVIKNPKAQITEAALRFSGAIYTTNENSQCLIVHGRPCPESMTEIWAQFQLAYGRRNPFGQSYYKFLRYWFVKSDYKYALNVELESRFYSIIAAHSVAFTESQAAEFNELLGIDERLYTIERCELSDQQKQLIEQLRNTWSLPTFVGELERSADRLKQVTEFNYTMQIRQKHQQICSGFYYDDGDSKRVVRLDSNPKFELLISILRELRSTGHHHIVVWTRYVAEHNHIIANMAYNDLKCCMMDGDNPEALKDFAEIREAVIVVSEKAARGINYLSCADVNIFFSNGDSQELRDQKEARIDRLGQKSRIVKHIDLCTDSLDYEIAVSLQTKNLTPERLSTLVRQHLTPRKAVHNDLSAD